MAAPDSPVRAGVPWVGRQPAPSWWRDRHGAGTALTLLGITGAAWLGVVAGSDAMTPMTTVEFFVSWGVMMAAMMLPGAVPMISLYAVVARAREGGTGDGSASAAVFTAPYLLVWIASGVPAYGLTTAFHGGPAPEASAALLAGAGAYQLTPAKHACLRQCQAPLQFLARRWRPGVLGAIRLGLAHAAYCLSCCWALMVVLVVVGSMGLPWVVLIAALVLAEKLLPAGQRVGYVAGAVLLVLALTVLVAP